MAAPLRLSCVLLAALAALQPSSAQNFCNISSCRSPSQHTMCRFTSSRVSRACGAVRVSSVSAADRAEILRVHNDLRRAVQRGAHRNRGLPAARYMPNLRWSSSLARIAQRWANQCQTGHDQCRNLPGKYVGQNFAWSGNQAKDWRNRIANACCALLAGASYVRRLDVFSAGPLAESAAPSRLSCAAWCNRTSGCVGFTFTDGGQ
ncbi:Venom allergen 5 [Amphibalanus amphitrite]|uniref:Venom allergen 5 n=1 Tax=Amphibalanus amphitrite TaxID=1232801 RepID=A0A6A4WPJ9_AMPAM|nr:Venom allergen 5 [Amphibalanus amphitrite]